MACKTNAGHNCTAKLTEEQEMVLRALAAQEGPAGTREISEATGIASKSVSCRIQSLKKKGLVQSPARCKYEITDAGRSITAG